MMCDKVNSCQWDYYPDDIVDGEYVDSEFTIEQIKTWQFIRSAKQYKILKFEMFDEFVEDDTVYDDSDDEDGEDSDYEVEQNLEDL